MAFSDELAVGADASTGWWDVLVDGVEPAVDTAECCDRMADRILVLHHGRLAAAGTHDELRRTSSVYRTLTAGQLHA